MRVGDYIKVNDYLMVVDFIGGGYVDTTCHVGKFVYKFDDLIDGVYGPVEYCTFNWLLDIVDDLEVL